MPRRTSRANRAISWIEGYCRVPEGALVGKPVRLRQWQRQEIRRIYDNPAGTRRAILSFGRKNGKGLALDTPIPTPAGWRTMADIEEGDEVFGADGEPTKVIGVSEIHTGLNCWRLTFSDGSRIVADEQHQWWTRHSYRPWEKATGRTRTGHGGRWKEAVVTTPQIAGSVFRPRASGYEHNHKIVSAPALTAPARDLPIDPYLLGAWLGDGDSASAIITAGDRDLAEMVAHLESSGAIVSARRERKVNRLQLRAIEAGLFGAQPVTKRSPDNLQLRLRALGVLGRKHIPSVYFDAGTDQRWALLQGLMDTDGTVSSAARTRQCQYVTVSQELATGVWRLLRSLGIKGRIRTGPATLRGEIVNTAYSITFNATRDQPIFRLKRKQDRLPDQLSSRNRTLSIIACQPVESVPTKCIAVDAPDRLYLAGHGCVPTHNTALSAFLLLLHLCGPEAKPNSQLYSTAQSRDQAAILFALAAKIVRMSPDLYGVVVIRDTAKQLFCPELGTVYRALSAEAKTAYGLSPALVIHDELGQVRGPRSPLYGAMETATGAQQDALSIIISTQAPTDADLLSILIDDGLAAHDPRVVVALYTAPLTVDAFSKAAIKAANPAFGDFLNADEVLAMAEDARRMPARQAEFENLILNRSVEGSAAFVSRSLWLTCNAPALPIDRGPVYGGLDLSAVGDLTALVLVGQVEGVWQVHPTFWLPADGLTQKARADRVPYDLWHRDGYLEAAPGSSIDYEYVAEYLRGVFDSYDVRTIAFDRWGFRHLRPWLLKAGFTEAFIEAHFTEFGQGYQDMSPSLRALEGEILNARLAHGGHPVLTMCAANAVIATDPAGNRKFEKAKASGRIDGMVALAMAIAAGTSDMSQNVNIRALIG